MVWAMMMAVVDDVDVDDVDNVVADNDKKK